MDVERTIEARPDAITRTLDARKMRKMGTGSNFAAFAKFVPVPDFASRRILSYGISDAGSNFAAFAKFVPVPDFAGTTLRSRDGH